MERIMKRFGTMAVFFGFVFFFAGGNTSGKIIGTLLVVCGVAGLALPVER